MKKNWKTGVCRTVLALSISLAAAGIAMAEEGGDTVFVPGTSVNGLGIADLTVDEAAERIGSFYTKDYTLTIKERGGKQETITGEQIGFSVKLPDGFLQEKLNQQNAGGRVFGPDVDNKYKTDMVSSFQSERLEQSIQALDCITGNGATAAADARISDYAEGEAFTVIPEIRGNQVDPEKAAEAIRAAVHTGAMEVDLEALGCYIEPRIYSGDETLKALCDTMNQCREMEITYAIGEESQVLPAVEICSWITGASEGQIQVDREKAGAWIGNLAAQYDTAGKTRQFSTVSGRIAEVTGPYGWKIDQAAETDALIAMIRSGQSQTREPQYASTAAVRGEQDWGSTYAEVDLTGQHVYLVKDGAVIWDAPCVTGNISKKYDTPPGIFPLTYKQKDKVLRGAKRADGTYEYESPVSFWMPFNGGIGFHDANWRSSFGGEIYKTGGSHGCINLPPDRVPAFYEQVYKGMPVISTILRKK